jgi:hypothetical protein
MSVEVLEYIQDHIADLQQSKDEVTDHSDMIWHEGAIDALEHVLAKFGVNV